MLFSILRNPWLTSDYPAPGRWSTANLLLLPLLFISALRAQETTQSAFTQRLPIPPQLVGTRRGGETVYELSAQTGSRAFFQDKDTLTFGSNGDYLGPTLRLRRGEDVRIRVGNELEEATTVHWQSSRSGSSLVSTCATATSWSTRMTE